MGRTRRQVVIVGGGFAGLSALVALKGRHDAVLVDGTPDFEFTPHVPEIISGVKRPKELRLSRSKVADRLDQSFVEARAERVDLRARVVHVAGGRQLAYDALVLAPGGAVVGADVPGVAEHAIAAHRIEGAAAIARRLSTLVAIGGAAHVTVVGGGFTGVEVVGEILRAHRDHAGLRLRLVESGDRLMRAWPRELHQRLVKLMEKHGVELRFGERVASVGADHLALESGEQLPSQLTIWATGKVASPLLAASGLLPGRADLRVQDTLQTFAFPEVFVAGDAAHLSTPAEKQAVIALQTGEHAGKNADRFLAGKLPRPYEGQREYALILPFGDLSAFLISPGGRVLESPVFMIEQEGLFQDRMSRLDDATGETLPEVLHRMSHRLEDSFDRLPPLSKLWGKGASLRVVA